MSIDLDWTLDELEDELEDADDNGTEEDELEESLLRYQAEGHDVRMDVPISQQAGDETEALALAQVVCGLHRRLEGHIQSFEEHTERQIQVLKDWLEHETARWQKQVDKAEERLREFALDYYEETKVVHLPGATLRRAKHRDRIQWDEELARRYQAEHYPEDMQLAKQALKDRLEQQKDGSFVDPETGEVVDFVRMIERDGEWFAVSHEEGS